MPMYDFMCVDEDCLFVDEMKVEYDDYELKKCPCCGKDTWKRQLSAPMVMKEAIPDGQTNRFADLKTAQVLKKAASEAARKRDIKEEKRLNKERKKVSERSNK